MFFYRYFYKKLITNADVFPYIKGVHLKMFPLPQVSDEVENELSDLVSNIIENKKLKLETSSLETKVNMIVYKLYGLTDTEIMAIEDCFSKW